MTPTVRRARDADERERAFELRHEVFATNVAESRSTKSE